MANIISAMLSWLAQGSVLFPLVTSLIIKGKIPLPLKVVRLYLIFTFLVQAGITVLLVLHINNLFLFHVYIIEAFILLALFYRELLKKTYPFKDSPVKRRIFLIAIVLFIVFAVVSLFFINGIKDFPTYPFLVEYVFMIICALQYHIIVTRSATRHYYVLGYGGTLSNNYADIPTFNLYESPVFWINTGILLYSSSSLLVALLDHALLKANLEQIRMLVLTAYSIFVIVLHIFMGIGFLKYKSSPTDVADMEQKLNKQL